MKPRTLVLGGARSGKSAHAEGLLTAEEATYVATSRRDPDDAEWTERIATHVARRPAGWNTVEASGPTDPARVLESASENDPPVLVDDIATWLTGVLDDEAAWDRDPQALRAVAGHADRFVASVAGCAARVVLVSSEVGLGVVPSTRSGRLFRDELGALNGRLAEVCDRVLLLVAGVPLQLR